MLLSPADVIELITPVDPDQVSRADIWVFDLCFLEGSLQPDDEALLRANDKIEMVSRSEARPPFTHLIRIEVLNGNQVEQRGER